MELGTRSNEEGGSWGWWWEEKVVAMVTRSISLRGARDPVSGRARNLGLRVRETYLD